MLGGVSLIGPVISIIALSVSLAKLVAEVGEGKEELRNLCSQIPEIEHRLTSTIFMTLSAASKTNTLNGMNTVDGTFEALESCWGLLNEAERHLIMSIRKQIQSTDLVNRMKAAAERLEKCLEHALRDQNIVMLVVQSGDHRKQIDVLEGQTLQNSQGDSY